MRLRTILIPTVLATLAACAPEPSSDTNTATNEAVAAEPGPSTPLTLPTVAPPLTRRDLLLAAADAASAYATGLDDTAAQRALGGRPFSLAIRLCIGDQGGSLFQRSVDEEKGKSVLRLQVRPDLDASALEQGETGEVQFEAVEGFWIPRPWLLDAACPAAAEPANPATPTAAPSASASASTPSSPLPSPSPTVGIAQFLDETSSRSRRRGDRPYELTRDIEPGAGPRPIDLQIEGRISALSEGKTITCAGRSAMRAPRCIISVRIDQVSLRQPGGEILATWNQS